MRVLRIYVYTLASHATKRYWRQGAGVTLVLALVARWLLLGVVVVAGVVIGLYGDTLATAAGAEVMNVVTRHYLHVILGLLVATSVMPERSRLDAEPYRYVPVSRHGVAAAIMAFGALRLPLILFLALAVGLSLGGTMSHASTWFVVTAGLGIAATLLGCTLHHELRTRPRRFYAFAVGAVTVVLLDVILESEIITSASAAWSSAVLKGAGWVWVLAAAAAGAAFVIGVHSRAVAMRYPHSTARSRRHLSVLGLVKNPTLRLAVVELQLLRRCSYPRYQFRAIALLLALLVVLMVFTPDDSYHFVTTLFVAAGLAISYAQLAFAWNADHFDGLFALPFTAEAHVQARWVVGSILASIPTAALLALFLIFEVGSPLALAACYLLTLGWLIALEIAMSMQWSQRVSLDGTAIGNLRAYSWHLYVAAFALWAGSGTLIALTSAQTTTLAFLGLGVVGLLIQPAVLKRIAGELNARLPDLAERMRTRA